MRILIILIFIELMLLAVILSHGLYTMHRDINHTLDTWIEKLKEHK
jgi:hypothetical protein